MKFWKKRGIISAILAGCVLFTTELQVFAAEPQSEAQTMETTNLDFEVASLDALMEQIPAMATAAVETQDWYGKALANTDGELDVYAQPNGSSVGKMYKNTVVTVVEEGAEL